MEVMVVSLVVGWDGVGMGCDWNVDVYLYRGCQCEIEFMVLIWIPIGRDTM